MVELVVGGGICVVLIVAFIFGGEVAQGVASLLVAIVAICLFVKYPVIAVLPVVILLCIGVTRWQRGKEKIKQQDAEQSSTNSSDNNSGGCILSIAGALLVFPTSCGMFFYFIMNEENSSLGFVLTAVCFISGALLIGFNLDRAKAEIENNPDDVITEKGDESRKNATRKQLKIIDIHGHYVYNVDDGPLNLEVSLDMLKSAYKQGIREVICTSHSDGLLSIYDENFKTLSDAVKENKIGIKLHKGCEVYCSLENITDVIECINFGDYYTLAKSYFVLLEFNPNVSKRELFICVNRIKKEANIIPVIAHIERYHNLHGDESVLEWISKKDIKTQINAYSLVAERNPEIRKFARKMLEKKLVTFIGSDTHGTNRRAVNMRSGVEYIYDNCDESYANEICYQNAKRHVIGGKRNGEIYG